MTIPLCCVQLITLSDLEADYLNPHDSSVIVNYWLVRAHQPLRLYLQVMSAATDNGHVLDCMTDLMCLCIGAGVPWPRRYHGASSLDWKVGSGVAVIGTDSISCTSIHEARACGGRD